MAPSTKTDASNDSSDSVTIMVTVVVSATLCACVCFVTTLLIRKRILNVQIEDAMAKSIDVEISTSTPRDENFGSHQQYGDLTQEGMPNNNMAIVAVEGQSQEDMYSVDNEYGGVTGRKTTDGDQFRDI